MSEDLENRCGEICASKGLECFQKVFGEALLRLYRKLKKAPGLRFRGKCCPRNFVLIVFDRIVFSLVRCKKWNTPEFKVDPSRRSISYEEKTHEETIGKLLERQMVVHCISQLDHNEHTKFLMTYLKLMSSKQYDPILFCSAKEQDRVYYEQIAETCSWTIRKTKNTAKRAWSALLAEMKKLFEGEDA